MADLRHAVCCQVPAIQTKPASAAFAQSAVQQSVLILAAHAVLASKGRMCFIKAA